MYKTQSFHQRNSRLLEVLGFIAILLIAALLRLYDLTNIPPGLHGDEAIQGLQARRFLADLHGGALDNFLSYNGDPFGYPLLLLPYFNVIIFFLFGSSLFTLKLTSAIIGISTIALIYFSTREMFNVRTAFFAAILATLSYYHIHFSRMAFPLVTTPLAVSAAILFLFKALRTNKVWCFLGSGLALGAGVYSYPTYPVLFFAPFIAFVAYKLVREPKVRAGCIALVIVAFFVAAPFFDMWLTGPIIQGRYHSASIYDDFAKLETPNEKAVFLTQRIILVPYIFFRSKGFDIVDALGIRPLFDPVTSVLVMLGFLLCLFAIKDEKYCLVLIFVMMAFIGMFTHFTYGGAYRRTITGFVPMMFMGGIGLEYVCKKLSNAKVIRNFLIFSLLFFVAVYTTSFYFGEFPSRNEVRSVYAHPLVKAAEYLGTAEQDRIVYFYGGQWSWNYEANRFLSADMKGEDRSGSFGSNFSIEKKDSEVVYVFLPDYAYLLDEVKTKYPGGSTTELKENDVLVFSSYVPP